MDPTQLGPGALAALATGGGAPAWALAIMFIIEGIKAVPQFEALVNGREKLSAFVLSGVLEVGAVVTAVQMSPPAADLSVGGIILAVMAWFTVARLSMALHDDRNRRPGTLLEPTAAELARTDPQQTIPATRPDLPAGIDPDPRTPGDTP